MLMKFSMLKLGCTNINLKVYEQSVWVYLYCTIHYRLLHICLSLVLVISCDCKFWGVVTARKAPYAVCVERVSEFHKIQQKKVWSDVE